MRSINELDPNFHYSLIGFRRIFSENHVISKKKGLRQNPKAFSGRNQKFKRFLRPKTVTFSSQKPALNSRWGGRLNLDGETLNLDGGTRPPHPPYNLSTGFRCNVRPSMKIRATVPGVHIARLFSSNHYSLLICRYNCIMMS